MEYYIIQVNIDSITFYFLWNSEDEKLFLSDRSGAVVFFTDVDAMKQYIKKNNILVDDEIAYYNLCELQERIVSGEKSVAVLNDLIDCWNLIDDLSISCKKNFIGVSSNIDYFKLYNLLYVRLLNNEIVDLYKYKEQIIFMIENGIEILCSLLDKSGE